MSVTIINSGSIQAGISPGGVVQVGVSPVSGSTVVVEDVGGGGGGPVQVSPASQAGSPVSVSGGSPNEGAVQVGVSPGIGPSVVVNGTSTSIVGTAGVNPFVAGANITITTTGGGITVIGRDPPVYSVNGKSGTVVLSVTDLTAAAASHTHATIDIAGFGEAAAGFAPVQSVAGKVGVVTLRTTDVSGFSAAVQSFSRVQSVAGRTGAVSLTTTDVSGLTAAIQSFSKVSSVQGKHGTVTLTVADLTAAPALHTHSLSDVGLSTLDILPPQEGQSGRYLKSVDGTATWAAVPISGGGGSGGPSGAYLHLYGATPSVSLSVSGAGSGAQVVTTGYARWEQNSVYGYDLYGYHRLAGVAVVSGGEGYEDYAEVSAVLGSGVLSHPTYGLTLRARTIFTPPTGAWTFEPINGPTLGIGLELSMTLERRGLWPEEYPADTWWKVTAMSVLSGGSGYAQGEEFWASLPTTVEGPYSKVALYIKSVGATGNVMEVDFVGWLSAFWKGGSHRGVDTGVVGAVRFATQSGDVQEGAYIKPYNYENALEAGAGKYRLFSGIPTGLTVEVSLPNASGFSELFIINVNPASCTVIVSKDEDESYSLSPGQWIHFLNLPDVEYSEYLGWIMLVRGSANA